MIDKTHVEAVVNGCISPDYEFVVEVSVSADSRIVVLLDGERGISIERCIAVSRAIEQSLDRDQEDFSLEVSSAGATSPLRVLRQYVKNVGRNVEVATQNGLKIKGLLRGATQQSFTVEYQEKIAVEGKKRKELVTRQHSFSYDEVKWTRVIVSFR